MFTSPAFGAHNPDDIRTKPDPKAPTSKRAVLNPGVRTEGALRIDAYEDESTPSGRVRKALLAQDGNQIGDVKKGAEACVDVLTRTGVAKGKDLPLRIVLGSDCVSMIREECGKTLKRVDEWEMVSASTDYT